MRKSIFAIFGLVVLWPRISATISDTCPPCHNEFLDENITHFEEILLTIVPDEVICCIGLFLQQTTDVHRSLSAEHLEYMFKKTPSLFRMKEQRHLIIEPALKSLMSNLFVIRVIDQMPDGSYEKNHALQMFTARLNHEYRPPKVVAKRISSSRRI